MFIHAAKVITESNWFRNLILLLILAAAVIVGLETYPSVMERHGDLIHLLDWVVILAFTVEAILKIMAGGRRWYDYFRDPWNVFDFTIVVVCLLPVGGHAAAVLRLVRIIRALRLISALPKLQIIVGALIKSMPSMGYVGLLLALHFYIYAVLGVFLWGKNDPAHFGTLQDAMLSLFRTVTLEDWTDLMYTNMYGSDVYAGEYMARDAEFERVPQASPLLAPLYFVSFVMLGTMIMLNLFIGVIMSGMGDARAEAEREIRDRNLETYGRITIEDEIDLLVNEIDGLRARLGELRYRVKAELPPMTLPKPPSDAEGSSSKA